MTLRHLKIFVEVCEKGGVTRAAESLHVVQPVVSTAISELENKSSPQITAAIFAVSCVIFAFVFCVGYKIPFCTSCDDVSASELGFLTHWIEPSV